MGVENPGGSFLYLNVSCGKLINKQKQISAGAYSGTLLKIYREEDEIDGKKVMKIRLKMKDNKSDEIALISFTEESWYGTTFFQRISDVDVSKDFTLGVLGSEKSEKVSFCYIRQGDLIKKSEAYPIQEKKTIGRNEVTDFSACIDMNDKIIEAVSKKLEAAHGLSESIPSGPPEKGDDLPF